MECLGWYSIGAVVVFVCQIWMLRSGRLEITDKDRERPSGVMLEIILISLAYPIILTLAVGWKLLDKMGKMLISNKDYPN